MGEIDAYWDAYFEKECVHYGYIPLPKLKKGCSAFIAEGDAIADGQIVIGHNTLAGYAGDSYWNVIFHLKPQKGHETYIKALEDASGVVRTGS